MEHINTALMEAVTGRASNKLIVSIAPRHGKSDLISVALPAWWLGTYPDKPVILASYGADLAGDFGAAAKQIIEDCGPEVFGISLHPKINARDNWGIENHRGFLRSVGSGGPLTGRGGHLMICDDPIQNFDEYNSEAQRESLKQWFSSTFLSRAEADAVIVVASQRWGQLDLVAHLLEQDGWRHIELPALALENDPLGRPKGAALWPAMWPRESLLKKKANQGSAWFEVQHQCNVTAHITKLMKAAWLIHVPPVSLLNARRVRSWDLSAGRGDFAAGVRIAEVKEGSQTGYIVEDLIRGKFSPARLEGIIQETARTDPPGTHVVVEQEPGSSGVAYTDHLREVLFVHDFHTVRPTGSKESRWRTMLAAFERGDVGIVEADWNKAFEAELLQLPAGKHDDQADACAQGINWLASGVGGSEVNISIL